MILLIRKTLSRYGAYLIGISLLSGLMYLMFMYPPPLLPSYPAENIPIYSPYPGIYGGSNGEQLEWRLYLEEFSAWRSTHA